MSSQRVGRWSAVVLATFGWAGAAGATSQLTFSNLQGGNTRGLHVAADGQTVWAVEDGGRIRKTTNGFSSWWFQRVPEEARHQLNDVFFLPDGQRGWAVGERHTVLSTTNGGNTWQLVDPSAFPPDDPDPGPGDDSALWAVHFEEIDTGAGLELHGWITGRLGVLWHSADGGATWQTQKYNVTNPGWHLSGEDRYGVHFVRGDDGLLHGYVTGDWALILHTTDLGATWEMLDVEGMGHSAPGTGAPLPNIELYDVHVDAAGNGFAVGGVGNFLGRVYSIRDWTTVSWESLGDGNPAPLPIPPPPLPDVWNAGTTVYGLGLLGDGRAVAAGYASHLWRSTFEPSWESTFAALPAADPVTPALYVCEVVGDRAYAAGAFGVIRSTPNAAAAIPTWTDHHGTEVTRLHGADFVDSRFGWVAGQGGRIHRTINGGVDFEEVFTPIVPGGVTLRGLSFANTDHGLAVGDVTPTRIPLVAVTASGGGPGAWTQLGEASFPPFGGVAPDLAAVDLVGSYRAWAVGSDGWVLRSDDGGASWVDGDVHGQLPSVKLHGVSFLTPKIGVAVGAGGLAAIHAAGGWHPIPVLASDGTPFTGDLLDVAAKPPATIAAVGTGGSVFVFVPALLQMVEAHRESGLRDLHAVALSDVGPDLYAGGDDGAFVWFDGLQWNEPRSATSRKIRAIVPMEEDGFVVAESFVVNVFDGAP